MNSPLRFVPYPANYTITAADNEKRRETVRMSVCEGMMENSTINPKKQQMSVLSIRATQV